MFQKICKMSQKTLKKFVAQQLKHMYDDVTVGDGYVYAQGSFPVLLVAHLDTVHTKCPETFVYDNATDALSSPQGIGGDDRCGVYMILQIIKKFACSVLFCEDEEIGGVGAEKFIKTELAKGLDFYYIIELDRQGSNDAVFYHCENDAFEEFITKDFYKTAWGTFSDISVLAPFFGCAAVNLSCGYYKAHTANEYVVLSEMDESIYEVCKILDRTTEDDKYDYLTAYNGKGYYDYWDSAERMWYVEYVDKKNNKESYVQIYAETRAEAVGKFCIDHPHIPYEDIDVWEW